jgi:phosphohistidine phosphatase
MPKRLVLIRHAKSSWSDPTLADHDRPLNDRGRRAAALVGRYLRSSGIRPDLVLCSSARRAQQTLEGLDIGADTVVSIENGLYGTTAEGLLRRLQEAPAAVGCIVLIGHNPAVEDLARMLTADGLAATQKFPTGAVVDIGLPMPSWAEIRGGVGLKYEVVTPRNLE